MASSGPNYSSTWSSVSSSPYSGYTWTNVGNLASGSTLATITHASYDTDVNSYLARGTGFGFSLPSGGTVDGITVEISGRYDAGTAQIYYVALVKDGAAWGTGKSPAQAITNSLATYTFGSSSDQWGTSSPTTDNINETDFGVQFSVRAKSDNTDISFDWARITVNYTESTARSGSASFLIQKTILSGSGTNTPPARSASTTHKIQLPILSASGLSPQPRSGSTTIPFKVQTPIISSSATNVPPARSSSTVTPFKIQTPILSGTATNVPPARTANTATPFKVQTPILGGTATNVPPARSASSTFKLQSPMVAGTASTVVTDSLIAEYIGSLAKNGTNPGNNTDPTSTWNDIRGLNDGTLGTFSWDASSGWVGSGTATDPYALEFDGTSDTIALSLLNRTSVKIFSYEAWVKITGDSNPHAIVFENGGVRSYTRLIAQGTTFIVATKDEDNIFAASSQTGSSGTWVHVVGTCDGANLTCYVNGSAGTPATVSPGTITLGSDTRIGSWALAGYYFDGTIASVRIYDKCLSQAEITQNYNAGILGHSPVKIVGTSSTKLQLPIITATATNEIAANRDATGTAKLQSPIITSSGTSPQPIGTGSLLIQHTIISGSVTNVPPPRSASSTFRVQSPLVSSTGANTPPARSASSTFKIQTPLVSGTGTNVPPARSATGGLRAQPAIVSSTGTASQPIASGTFKLQSAIITSTATNTPPTRTGSGGARLQSAIITSTAANVPPARSASGGLKLQSVSMSATGYTITPRTASGGILIQHILIRSTTVRRRDIKPAKGEKIVHRLEGSANFVQDVKFGQVDSANIDDIIVIHKEGAEHGNHTN